jgi:ABC-type nitrate/sulfonate/bicarbonate transport system permease component
MVSGTASTAPAVEALEERSTPRRARSGLRVLLAALDPMRLAGAALFVAMWQAMTYALPPVILPTPLGVLRRTGADFWSAPSLSFYGVADANLYANLIYTTENVAFAVLIGTAIGVAAGLVSARFSLFRAVVDPVVLTAGTVPILIAAPFLLIWFGATRASAVSLVTFYVVVILYIFAQRAASNLDPIFEQYARTFGATKAGMVRDILVPGTIPEILGGFRIALAGAWGLEAISELLGSQSGMGKVLEVLAGATDAQGIMACLLLLGITAIVADASTALVIARVAAWSTPAR